MQPGIERSARSPLGVGAAPRPGLVAELRDAFFYFFCDDHDLDAEFRPA